MGCVSVEASRRLRWGCLSLAAIVTLLTVTTDPADARSRRKRHHVKSSQAPESYNPPYAAIVVDARSGAVLHQSAADNPRHPASLTKIMTLYLLFERLDSGRITLDTPMDVSEHAASQAPTKLGLKPGSTIRVEDAIKGLVTKSANDAAVVVAETLGGSEEDFARAMTHKAHALGMRNTVYRNASGLPDDEQVTTARDQALLGIAIQERFPKHYRYFSLASFVYRGHAMANHNRLLGRVEGVDGIKTGYTRSSGFNLVTSVKRGARRIVAVVLGGRSGRARDARFDRHPHCRRLDPRRRCGRKG
jgi:D-alanyl-D-alanine carboxypeptidase